MYAVIRTFHLDEQEACLAQAFFVACHKSHPVNLSKGVERVNKDYVKTDLSSVDVLSDKIYQNRFIFSAILTKV